MGQAEGGGVYLIRCQPTGKVYVGCTTFFRDRWMAHRYMLRNDKHHNRSLQADWLIFGEDAFVFETIEVIASVAARRRLVRKMQLRERIWIAHYYQEDRCYNDF